jgi:hypothetical protein
MALTRLTDVIVPEVFNAYMLVETMTKADIFKSGIVAMKDDMAGKLAGGGETFNTPFWTDLSNTGSKVASDNPATIMTLDKIAASKMQFRRQLRTNGWSTADLVQELAGDDPMKRIVSRVSEFWARDMNSISIATLNGVINSNILNNAGDMVYNAGVGTGIATPTAAISATAVLEAKQGMGDRANELRMIMMHSRVYTNLQIQNLITFIPNSEGKVVIPTYLGYQVLVSDTCPVVASGINFIYVSYLCAPGVLGYGESAPAIPVETFRQPAQGNGMGVEELYTRRQFALHPAGHTWKEITVVGDFPTNAELELAANWGRVYPERKQVPFVALRTLNG